MRPHHSIPDVDAVCRLQRKRERDRSAPARFGTGRRCRAHGRLAREEVPQRAWYREPPLVLDVSTNIYRHSGGRIRISRVQPRTAAGVWTCCSCLRRSGRPSSRAGFSDGVVYRVSGTETVAGGRARRRATPGKRCAFSNRTTSVVRRALYQACRSTRHACQRQTALPGLIVCFDSPHRLRGATSNPFFP